MTTFRVFFVIACLGAPAWAQDPDGGTASAAADAPAPGVPPEPWDGGASVAVVTPVESAPTPVDAVAKVLAMFRLYGMFKPTIAAASAATESFSQPNLSAMTAAGNPAYASSPDSARLSFQMAQSRLGVWFGEGTPYRGQVELDFIDFSKASPTVASLPRLRIAKLEWGATSFLTVMAGQDWGLEQPVNPHGINLVGGAFQSGNTGFMRQQIKALFKVGDFELGAAAGLQNNNNTSKDGLVELSFSPTGAARAQWNITGKGRLGVSAIGTSVLLRAGAAPIRTFAGEAGVYGDVSLTKDWNLRFEGYVGQNTANLFLLGLGQGRVGTNNDAVDVAEGGGFISTRLTVAGPLSLYGTFGGASVFDETKVVPSYSYAGTIDPSAPPALGSGSLAGSGPGITWNLQGRVGFDVKIWKGLSFLAEGFWYRTHFALQTIDLGRTTSVGQTFGTELGFLWAF